MSNQPKNLSRRYSVQFNFKLILITLLLSFILVYLGAWQLGRAAEKKNILLSIEQSSKVAPLDLANITAPSLAKDRFRKVQLTGVFLNEFHFLIDNQIYNHKAGFRVLTPVKMPKLDNWVLIDRGWIERGAQIESLHGLQQISGLINTIASGIILKKDVVSTDAEWPIVLQRIDYELIAQYLQHPVFNFVVQLNNSSVNVGISSAKHLGYAIQWFSFAAITIVYFLIVSIRREPSL